MRLLEIYDDGRFGLTKDLSVPSHGQKPEYAILSHTWGPDEEEVTFDDLEKNVGGSKAGYMKLLFCSRRAQRDHLRYFWVDTCCIDKRNNTELTEAINSMFRWYRYAKKCYVYLTDVSMDCNVHESSDQAFEKSMQGSRWFKRGWTLQELIAPASVEFFSVEEQYIGSKHTLEQLIHRITDIPVTALKGAPLSQFSVDERLKWTKGRRTHKDEDQIYCLLGIFGISMSIIYGEQIEGAFNRLMHEINHQKYGKDSVHLVMSQSLSSNGGQTTTYDLITSPKRQFKSTIADGVSYNPRKHSSPHFTGRREIIARLSNFFALEGEAQRYRRDFVLHGLGGCGKTQICLKFAEESSDKFWRIYWIDATNATTLDMSFTEISQDPAARRDSVEATKESVSQWLSFQDKEWLLVFDNADEEPESIESYLPISIHGNVLITSRNPNMRRKVRNGAFAHVGKMDEEEAVLLLSKAALIEDESDQGTEKLKSIVHQLGCIPLAIDHAASAIASGFCKLFDYLDIFQCDPLRLLGHDSFKGASQYDLNLISSWEMSRAAIRKQKGHETALHLFRIFAFFHPNGIMEDIFRKAASFDPVSLNSPSSMLGLTLPQATDHLPRNILQGHEQQWDVLKFREGIVLLFKHSFIQIGASNTYSVHPLVQYWERHCMKKSERLQTFNEVTALLTAAAGFREDYEAPTFRRQLITHVHTLNRLQVEFDVCDYYDDACQQFWSLFAEQERWVDAEKIGLTLLRGRQQYLGAIHPKTIDAFEYQAQSLSNLGCCQKVEKLQTAEKLQKRALIYKQIFRGVKHESTLDSMHALALIHFQQTRYEDAEKLLEGVLKIQAHDSDCSQRRKLKSAAALSKIYLGRAKYEAAVVVLSPYVEYMNTSENESFTTTLEAMSYLATVYHELYRLQDAEELRVKILEARKRLHGHKHPATLTAMANLSTSYVRQERLDEAMSLVEPLIALRKETLGERHRDTLTAVLILTNIYIRQCKWKEAEDACEFVVHGRESELQFNHPHTLWSKAHLALIYHHQHRFDESADLWTRIVSAQKEVRGDAHVETLLSSHNLALVRRSQRRLNLASEIMERTFRLRMKTLGCDHFRTYESYQALFRWDQPQTEEIAIESPSPLSAPPFIVNRLGINSLQKSVKRRMLQRSKDIGDKEDAAGLCFRTLATI